VIRPVLIGKIDEFTAVFIEYLRNLDEAAGLFESVEVVEEVKRLKRQHLIGMASCDYDRAYVDQRVELGFLYSKIGLDTRVFLGAFHHLMRTIGTAIMANSGADLMSAFDNFMSLKKVAFFDIGLIVDIMVAERERTISAQQQAILVLNSELELRVKDRTVQLETANRELVMAKEEAEQATQAKTNFLSSMSHELRTPLNAILGFGQLLESEVDRATKEQKADFVRHIIKAGRHLLTLINEILDLAKIEAGHVALSPEPVALSEILSECRAMLEPLAAERGVRMIFPEESQLHVQADRVRLKQVLLNLLSNAIKYNRYQGAVVVESVLVPPDKSRVSVQDTGLGVPRDQMHHLFKPFNRLGQEAGQQEGTGIGLVVTKRLVEMMGGAIGVTSEEGVGSTFWIELPLSEPAVQSAVNMPMLMPIATSPVEERPLLLYVEDNPANLKLIEEIISFRGDLDLISAPDGQLGVQLARAHLPNLVLMDIHLPGLSGAEAQQILKEDPRTAHIPIIALTANAMPREIAKGLAAGFFRYITKPIDITELSEAINSALHLENAARAVGKRPAGR
jgi:signal transduction histidine kinase/CheY-like chemotaxis protein